MPKISNIDTTTSNPGIRPIFCKESENYASAQLNNRRQELTDHKYRRCPRF